MRSVRKSGRSTRVRLAASAVLVAASGGLMLLFSRWGRFLFPAYRAFTKGLIRLPAMVASAVPFALWDFVALGLILAAVVTLARRIRRREPLLPWLSVALLLPSALLFAFVAGWALNHYAPPLADDLQLNVYKYSTDQLANATAYYYEQASRLAPEVPREADGPLSQQDFYDLARVSGSAYQGLGDQYPVYAGGSAAPVKALLLWGEPLLYSGYVGMFFSPTGEAGVPLRCAPADMPFTMCHEAAHRLGIASEEEANFAAFMACTASSDVRFRYAGYYNAFVYCLNALASTDAQRAQQVVQSALGTDWVDGARLVLDDHTRTRDYYKQFRSRFQQVGDSVNNTYLKSFGESSGVRSYGLVVDYLIAWHER